MFLLTHYINIMSSIILSYIEKKKEHVDNTNIDIEKRKRTNKRYFSQLKHGRNKPLEPEPKRTHLERDNYVATFDAASLAHAIQKSKDKALKAKLSKYTKAIDLSRDDSELLPSMVSTITETHKSNLEVPEFNTGLPNERATLHDSTPPASSTAKWGTDCTLPREEDQFDKEPSKTNYETQSLTQKSNSVARPDSNHDDEASVAEVLTRMGNDTSDK